MAFAQRYLALLTFVFTQHHSANGFPDPANIPLTACTTMTPQHGFSPSSELSPYVVLVSKSTYEPGDSVSVMLRGLCGHQFQGFMVQARRADPADARYQANPSQAVGTFVAVAGTQYFCGDNQQALVHSERYNGTTILFNWTAPNQPQGHVQLKATFVEKRDTYWVSVASVVIQDPRAAQMSVDPNSLRTDFIEPCPIDRAPTTTTSTTTTPTPTTTTTATSPSTTTTSTLSTTTGVVTTTTTTTTAKQPATTEAAQAPSVDDQTTPRNININTTRSAFFPLETDIRCGETHGCFRQCGVTLCDFRVAWQSRSDGVWFDVMVRPLDVDSDQWVAVAFSEDHKMGKDSVVECLADQDRVVSHLSFNGDHENDIVSAAQSADMLSDVQMAVTDGYLHCQFVRKMNTTDVSEIFDLEQDWYLLLAQGLVDNGRKDRHEGLPLASARLVDLQSFDDVGPWTRDMLFIKIHGSLMVFAWVFCAGFGIVMARFCKPLWPAHKLCGRKVWFTVHRLCTLTLGILTLLSFVIVFVQAEGLTYISAREFQKLHPIVGMIVTVFVVVQIVFGIFRPSADSKNRPVFNWGHWMLGMACQILAVFNMGLGLKLRKAGVHVSGSYILYVYALYQVTMVIILEIITCNIRIKERKQASYVIYERRSTIYSSTKEIMEGEANEPPGSIALRIALRIHLLFVTAFAAALIALICIAH